MGSYFKYNTSSSGLHIICSSHASWTSLDKRIGDISRLIFLDSSCVILSGKSWRHVIIRGLNISPIAARLFERWEDIFLLSLIVVAV